MNAEIKSSNRILINRLDESEKILLSEIYNKYEELNSTVNVTSIIDDDGDFGGILLNIVDGDKKDIDVLIPTEVYLNIGDYTTIEVNTNVKDNNITILSYINNNNQVNVNIENNLINIAPIENQDIGKVTLQYIITADEYKDYKGTLIINIVPNDKAKVILEAIDEDTSDKVEASFTVEDKDNTIIIPNEDNTYDLEIGTYTIKTTSKDALHTNNITSIEIISDDLSKSSITKTITLSTIL
jgi:hypothetical protein